MDRLGKSLVLMEDEVAGLEISSTGEIGNTENAAFLLVGRLFTPRAFRYDVLSSTLNIAQTCSRALRGCPWTFDRNLVILQSVPEDENLLEVDLNWCQFYVHVHDLPLRLMTREVAEDIGDRLGRELTAALTYERLPNFCYICGILGHIMQDCSSAVGGKGTEGGEDLQYGAWLRESRTVRVSFPSYRGSEGGLWGSHQGQRGRKGTSIFDFRPQNSKVMEQRPDSGGGLAAPVTSVVDEGGPRIAAWQLTPQGNVESWRGNFGSGCKVAENLEETTICENPRSAKQLGQERIPNIPSPYQELSSIQTVGPATIRTQPIDFPLAQPEISTPTPSPILTGPSLVIAQTTSNPELEITLMAQTTPPNVKNPTPFVSQPQTNAGLIIFLL
ncbi:hypothetical protein Sango_2380700 [Sesamum angolense]|uniref:CCHC-type domain-containing protein n=1 Tax=Sesamum angolense TaxID=2727404 RepID=A0AAE2BJK7_9LAMI|nr:hypothetical protein Sango_2380700 [Sesamum angolense]